MTVLLEELGWGVETALCAHAFGWTIVETAGELDRQGWGAHLLRKSVGDPAGATTWAVMTWEYGTCPGCDGHKGSWYVAMSNGVTKNQAAVEIFRDLIQEHPTEDAARLAFANAKGW